MHLFYVTYVPEMRKNEKDWKLNIRHRFAILKNVLFLHIL